jgi:hypothetical protein
MVAAIGDGVRAAGRADARAAAPLRAPRDLAALGAFAAVALAVLALGFHPPVGGVAGGPAGPARIATLAEAPGGDGVAPAGGVDAAELALVQLEVDDLRAEAVARGDDALVAVADRLAGLLAAAAAGELGKEDLLAAVDALLSGGRVGRIGGRLADVTDAIHRLPPPPPPPPPAPPPPPGTDVCTGGASPPPPQLAPRPPSGVTGQGDDHDPLALGPKTPRRGGTHEERLAGAHGDGESRRQTIRAAARRGFAARGYVRVYADYRAVVEEALASERVPQGYRTAVKRYFGLIHPQR